MSMPQARERRDDWFQSAALGQRPVLRRLNSGVSHDERFERTKDAQAALAAELQERLAAASLGGPVGSRERHVARGKLLPRDRVTRLLDEGSPFIEIAPLAADGLYGGEAPAAGVIAGIGL